MELRSEVKYSISNLDRTEFEMIIGGLESMAKNPANTNVKLAEEYTDMANRLLKML